MSFCMFVLYSLYLINYCLNQPQFYYVNVGFKGVKIIVVCFRDEFIIIIFTEFPASNADSVNPFQKPCFGASELGLHC